MVVSLLWVVVAPVYARGLALIGRALIPVLEAAPDTQYMVEGGRLLASRTLWLPKQQRSVQFNMPLWEPKANYGVPLLGIGIKLSRKSFIFNKSFPPPSGLVCRSLPDGEAVFQGFLPRAPPL